MDGARPLGRERALLTRELVVLGTASQVPTRSRNHNGYVLRWDDEVVLLDPGEGTQRQLTLAGVSAASLTRICITHAHGDHCLGLPGVLQRLALDAPTRPVDLHFPASMQPHVDAARRVCAAAVEPAVRDCPIPLGGAELDEGGLDEGGLDEGELDEGREVLVASTSRWRLTARPLDHRVDTVGYRLEEAPGVAVLPDRLAAAGIAGPDVGRLLRAGSLRTPRGVVEVGEVTVARRGQVFAFVMDTRACPAAVELARGADLLVTESTFLDRDADLAARYGHLTARQAGVLARDAGARRLVLTHFSQRYGEDAAPFVAEAAGVFPDVGVDVAVPEMIAAEDLARVPVPPRGTSAGTAGGARTVPQDE